MISPFFLYGFINGTPERYAWLTTGPAPFSDFGGGPFQLALYCALAFTGLVLLTVAYVVLASQRVVAKANGDVVA